MNDSQIFPAPILEICRSISKDEFKPNLEEDVVYFRPEAPLSRPFSRLLIDDSVSNPGLVRPPGKDKTFIAHFHNALLVHDAMCIVTASNRVPPPDVWDDYSMFEAVAHYHNRATPRAAFPVTWTKQALHNEMEYYIQKSASIYATMANGPHEEIRWANAVKGQAPERPNISVGSPYILLSNTPSNSYFNFIMDIVPRLWIFDEFPELRECQIVIPPLGEKFEQALADLAGVPRSQLLVIPPDANARFTFKHLIFPSAVSDRMLSAERLAFIRTRITGRPATPIGTPRRRIYLSRSDRPYKTVANEAELQAALEPYGFETIIGSELSIAEQAKIFGETEMLIGVGGGGFANTMFMPPGSMVLELSQATPPVMGQKRQLVMELASLNQLHHMVLTSHTDVHNLPRMILYPVPECPTSMVYDAKRVCKAVENCLAMLQCQTRAGGLWAEKACA